MSPDPRAAAGARPALPTLSQLRDVARRHGIRPSRALGQHFLYDGNTLRRIVRLSGAGPRDRVLEVGAGLGTLTAALADAVGSVVAVEFDRSLLPALEEVLRGRDNVEVVEGDALRLDYRRLLGDEPCRFVSNLPYNVATPLVATLLESAPGIGSFLVTVQREVGERLAAPPGSRVYGAVTVLVAYHCRARVVGRVPPTVFWPRPKVESVLVELVRRPAPVPIAAGPLMEVVRAAFSQRRKTLRNSLAAALGRSHAEIEGAMREAGVGPAARAEDLPIEGFAALAAALGAG